MISLRHFLTSTFTDLSLKKRWMLRISLGLVVLGLGAKGMSEFAGTGFGSGEWTWTSVQSGVGYVAGFLVGAALRIFVKLSLLVGFVLAAVGFGLAKLGWVDLPTSEFGELWGAFAEASKRQLTDLHALLGGFLPASAMSGLGVASGITQRPDWTPED